MVVVSTREFRTNQTAVLSKALEGESILLTSRIGTFKITPVTEADTLTERICRGLEQVKMIEEGMIKAKPARDFLNEL